MSFASSCFWTIRVGTETPHNDFLLPEGLVSARSEFFRKAMKGGWMEGQQKLIKLPEDEKAIVALYLHLVYTGDLIDDDDGVPTSSADYAKEKHQDRVLTLVKLYVFAEKVQDKVAKNKSLEALKLRVQKGGHCDEETRDRDYLPSGAAVQLMYDNTPEGSLGRLLMVNLWCTSTTNILAGSEVKSNDFFADLATALHHRLLECWKIDHPIYMDDYWEK
ncbi:BTB POZ domain containing [Pyrenophora seminiperda CCB06]|uniref:BTB POZ domain containing n=1 Tax=Pyrenophora seminiperda CCB06 TaxID=1302712 RepID=A0A3M7M813_9PLEO|nr:BTB POZ domain containing [Pyrenophora seminiperda CCB06]